MTIYTKKGDKGYTSLFLGKRVKKSAKIIEALGTIDELNAWVGLLKLHEIQKDLMMMNAMIAGVKTVSRDQYLVSRTLELEKKIDEMQTKLPVLKNFILPQNQIHIARCVCRRAERSLCGLTPNSYLLTAIKYLNRLSDYLFVLARFEDFKRKKKEAIWKF